MDIIKLNEKNYEHWDNYISTSSWGNFFQLASWQQIISSYFKHETHFVFAQEDNRIVGILPLILIKNRILGSYITSTPGGLISNDYKSAKALADYAVEVTKENGAKYLVLRDCLAKWNFPDFEIDEDHCTLVVPMDTEESMWSKLKRHERRSIRDSEKKGIIVSNQTEHIGDFYPVYLQAMRERGTPPLGRELFSKIAASFPENFNLQAVIYDNRMIAGGFIAPYEDIVTCTWAAIPREHFHFRPSQLLFWKIILYGAERNFKWVDLGRSQWDSGSYHFKRKFGAEPWPLYQYYFLNTISEPPKVGSSRDDQIAYRLFIRIWEHMPYKLTEILGYPIRRQMPFG